MTNWMRSMIVTDAERLRIIADYVDNMSPVYRAAFLRSPEDQLRNQGFDKAMREAQKDLLDILNA